MPVKRLNETIQNCNCQLNSIVNHSSQSHLPFTEAVHLCYTVNMDSNQHIWRVWVEKAHRWGFGNAFAALLEAAGPLTALGAQMIYLAQPLLSPVIPGSHLNSLAELLEQPDQTRLFTAMLREGTLQ